VNWHYISDKIGYGHVTDVHVFAHLWSISLEWQFYLLWPVAVALLARRAHGERLVAIAAGLGALVSAILMMHWGAIDPTHAYEGTDTRAFALLLGAAAATSPIRRLVLRLTRRTATIVTIVLVAAIAVMWATATGTDARWLYDGGLLAHSLLAAALISVLAAWPRVAVSSVLASVLPRRLGDWSYSVYLWHWPIVVLLPPSPSAESPWIYAAVVLGLSTALGAVTTSVVENPFRAGGPWTRGWRGAIILIFAVATVLMIWFALPRPDLGVGIVDLDLL
jgi:peptidoglycan/LPS O-acetylase OafA/YrhL